MTQMLIKMSKFNLFSIICVENRFTENRIFGFDINYLFITHTEWTIKLPIKPFVSV